MSLDYTKYSYEDLQAYAAQLLKAKDGWKDAYQSSTGTVIIQLMAAMSDQLMYMLERRVQESYLPTAKLKSSVGAISNLLGYRPRRAVSANGTLSLRLVDGEGNTVVPAGDIVIPKFSPITFGDNTFVNTTEVNITPIDTPPYSIDVREGEAKHLTFDPADVTGTLFTNNFLLISDYEYMEENSLVIATASQEFLDVKKEHGGVPALESLAFAGPTDPVYDLRITNEGLQILFGDGINGAKPSGQLTISYILSSGESVRIPSTGLEFVFENSKLSDDSIPVNQYPYKLTNTTSIDGGFEPESIDTTKRNAPSYLRSAARAVTKRDYVFWTLKSGIGGIIDAAVYGEEERGISVIYANNVWLTYLTGTGQNLNTSELTQLSEYLDTYKGVTTHLVFQPAEIIPVQLNIRIKRSDVLTAANSEIFDYIKAKMKSYLALKEGSLNRTIYHSDIINYISGLQITKDGIARDVSKYVNVDVYALQALNFPLSKVDSSTVTIVAGTSGDDYVLSIDGHQYTQQWSGGDTVTTLADALAAKINTDPRITATSNTGVITMGLDHTTRTNEVLYSEDFTNVYYTKTGATISSDSGTAPNGTATADKIEEDVSFGGHSVEFAANIGPKSFAIYAMSGERTGVRLSFYNATDGERSETVFDLSSGTVTSGPGAIEVIADGWYKCQISVSSSAESDTVRIKMVSSGSDSYQGVAGNGVFIWGAQLEYDTTLGSYAPTNGTRTVLSPETQPYTISLTGSTNISKISLTEEIQLPLSKLKNVDNDDLFVPGSISLVKSDGTVLFTDDGVGGIAGGTVDYKTGVLNIPLSLVDGNYYFRYRQSTDSNLTASQLQAFSYYEPKAQYTDSVEELSTIEIIS